VAALAAPAVIFRPDRAVRVATGVVAHNVCAKTFVSGLDPKTVFAETTDRAGLRRLKWALRYDVDHTAKTVDASLAGVLVIRAPFDDGCGCVPPHGSGEPIFSRTTSTR
jgi:hypothetical protein